MSKSRSKSSETIKSSQNATPTPRWTGATILVSNPQPNFSPVGRRFLRSAMQEAFQRDSSALRMSEEWYSDEEPRS